jgi:glutathione reductase (NADPH)
MICGGEPRKMLVYGSHFAEDLHDAARYGWRLGDMAFDWKTLQTIRQPFGSRLLPMS